MEFTLHLSLSMLQILRNIKIGCLLELGKGTITSALAWESYLGSLIVCNLGLVSQCL